MQEDEITQEEIDDLLKDVDLDEKQPQLKEEQIKRNIVEEKEKAEKEALEHQFDKLDSNWKPTKGVIYGLDNEEATEGEWLEDV